MPAGGLCVLAGGCVVLRACWYYYRQWGVPKIRGSFLVVPLIRILEFGGLYWSHLFFLNATIVSSARQQNDIVFWLLMQRNHMASAQRNPGGVDRLPATDQRMGAKTFSAC